MITYGEGKYKVFLNKKELGDDLIFILGGGEKPHVGGAVICVPEEKPYVLTYKDHHDHIVLTLIAEAACKKYNKTVIVIGGIHIDNATKDEIELIIDNCKGLVKCI
jgi:gallate decarboxylase subunit D